MSTMSEILSSMHRKKVRLWTQNGSLCYEAPKGVLSSDDLAKLGKFKFEIVAFLQGLQSVNSADPPLIPRLPSNRAPLTFTQRWWWESNRQLGMIGNRRFTDLRFCASATRLFGWIDMDSLRKSLDEVVRRHEALRTRIVTVDGEALQEIAPESTYDLDLIDLSTMPGHDLETAASHLVNQVIYEPTISSFGARVIKLGDRDHILVVAMSHAISDRSSVDILVHDISVLYAQYALGAKISLPQLPIQYLDYAVWQQKTGQSWIDKHGGFWKERLANAPRVPFPRDMCISQLGRFKYEGIPIRFGESLSVGLRQLSCTEGTSLGVTILAVWVGTVLRWLGARDIAAGLLVNGRNRPELDNIIGFCASMLYLRIRLTESDTFLEFLAKVTHEYTLAYQEHYDYGRMSVPVENGFKQNTCLNWRPRLVKYQSGAAISGRSPQESGKNLRMESFPYKPFLAANQDFDGGGMAYDPSLALADTSEGVSGSLAYRSDLFDRSTMERVVRNFHAFAERVLEEPQICVSAMSYEV